ncbi:MAG: phosphate transport system protein [Bradyrhizobium sp.]|nr:phosphate transport system protein [Bradyrhizobium sp.]MEA2951822.1 phosphate transport system protein [Alphaproteobacteria bacterium]
MRTEHISRQYDLELDELGRKLGEFGSTVEAEIAATIAAVKNLGLRIPVANQAKADAAAMHRAVEYHAILIIVRRQPMAVDLREILGAFKTSQHLEQVRYFAGAIARQACAVDRTGCPRLLLAEFERLLELVRNHHRATLAAYLARDINGSASTSLRSSQIIQSCDAFIGRVLVLMKSGPDRISIGAVLLNCSHHIAGICKQLNCVAETAYFVVEGRPPSPNATIDDAPPIALRLPMFDEV